jgi:7,8-dihydroneopterin aldolase/epimerase/oxygenase
MYIFSIDAMEYAAHLGFYDEERAAPQKVRVSIKIYFPAIPACATDDYTAFIDYHALLKTLGKRIANQQFRLIEFMAQTLFTDALTYIHSHGEPAATLWLKLTKVAPAVPGLHEGASFEISNHSAAS